MKSASETSTTLLKNIASDMDNARWGEFVSRYRPMMFAYLASHFPALEAEDIVQETLVALCGVMPRYRYAPEETGHFRNYLTGILRNKALKRCERQAHEWDSRERYRQELAVAQDHNMVGQKPESDGWRRAIMEIAVRQLLADDHIHERSKQIFQRLTVDGESPDAVAAAYGTSRNNVDKIKSRMLARLKEIAQRLEAVRDVW